MRIFASRQCADYARASYAGAHEARVARVTFCCRPREASCLVFVVFKPLYAMAPLRRRSGPPSPSPKNTVVHYLSESSVSECVRLCDAHMAYT